MWREILLPARNNIRQEGWRKRIIYLLQPERMEVLQKVLSPIERLR